MVAIGTALSLTISDRQDWHFATGALDSNCAHSGQNPDSSVQFMVVCPQSSQSPDGRWIIRQTAPVGDDERYQVLLTNGQGRRVGVFPDLNDGMPFVLHWSPRPNWFMVNHWQGSSMERPRIFEIRDNLIVEHDRFLIEGQALAIKINPCFADGSFEANWGRPPQRKWANGTGYRWSRDGRRIIWQFQTRTDSCRDRDDIGPLQPEDVWRSFFMISDVESGNVDPASIRIIGDESRGIPVDGPYAGF